MTRLITDEMAQAAFDWLASTSDEIAHARGSAIRAEYRVKRVHARLFLDAEGSAEARKAWATCQDEYQTACIEHADAEGRWEALRDARTKMTLLIEAWRTQQSSERGVVRAGR